MTTSHSSTEAERLAALRAKIDAVDESIHALLMQRAGVIDELIAVKGARQRTGAAFRPGREAAMMEVLEARHRGSIPLTMIVHIWREIIATFTFLQAPYRVHVGGPAPAMRDCARFQFGFSVPLNAHESAADALSAVRTEGDALAVVSLDADADGLRWMEMLGETQGLYVMARLPALPDAGTGTADMLVIAPHLSDPAPFPITVHIATFDADAVPGNVEILAQRALPDGRIEALLATPQDAAPPSAALDIRPAGGYFAPVPQTLWHRQDD